MVPLSFPHHSLEYGNCPGVLSFFEDLWPSCLRSESLKSPWKTPTRRRTQELVEVEQRKMRASAPQLSNSKTFYQNLNIQTFVLERGWDFLIYTIAAKKLLGVAEGSRQLGGILLLASWGGGEGGGGVRRWGRWCGPFGQNYDHTQDTL